jgi:membrane-associated protease RseP (regulator of RpoE activity)
LTNEVGPPERSHLTVELLPGLAPAQPAPSPPPRSGRTAPRYLRAGVLFLITLFTTTTLGAAWHFFTRTDIATDLLPWLTPRMVRDVWTQPALLVPGLQFSLSAMLILLAHELGHYVACRRYGLPASLPYFLPAPFGLGTLGAFIRIKAPLRDKRQLFDVGVAGPFAGFVVLLPFLIVGLAWSTPAPLPVAAHAELAVAQIWLPGAGLLWTLLVRVLHGPLAPGTILNLHPFALGAWLGLFATMLNLLPLGQLDGGHILYAALGRIQRRLAWPLWVALGALGLYWPGFLVWSVITLLIGVRHPPVTDEAAPLGRARAWLAVAALLLFIGCFMPVPLRVELLDY